ncbi:site-specific integrase [Dyadobacter sp. CY345]|uniref:site-specific integrase n=1 Tax=Dyadobacter sp. CY345 TaxID=2909335 RepID=UPI001F25D619|nr:site-specific integrase [Dyadobacter sp. CY345]MCF2446227.1 site-specific integrase [Dyadobacter sp. CY345]
MGISKPTFLVVLDDRREKSNGTFPLKLRIAYNRKRKYINIGIDLSREDFNKLNTSKLIHLKDAKLKIKSLETKAENIYKEMTEFSISAFEKLFLAKPEEIQPRGVYGLLSKYVAQLKSEDRLSTASSYECTLNSLKKFKVKLTFEEITPEFLNAYERFMVNNGKSMTTVGIYLRSLRTIYNQAIEAKFVKQELYPFKKSKFQIPAGRNIKKALILSDIEKIFTYQTVHGSSMDRAKDFWIFSYLCNGLNLKDISRLRYKDLDGDNLTIIRAKTKRSTKANQKFISIHLTDYAKAIIKKWSQPEVTPLTYIFPILPENVTAQRERELIQYLVKSVNKYMKEIGEDLSITKPITSYTARHSFSTVLKRSGAPLEYISESLGHSSFQTTENYLDSFENESRKQYSNLLTKFSGDKS